MSIIGAGQAGELYAKVPSLHQVVIPLVRLLASDDLSWSDRCEIADAIAAAVMHHRSMAAERAHLQGAVCQSQQAEPYQGLGVNDLVAEQLRQWQETKRQAANRAFDQPQTMK